MKWVVVTEQNAPWAAWASKKQFLLWPFAAQVLIPNGTSLDGAAAKIEQAAQMAGQGGVVILSVGHGGLGEAEDAEPDEGFFDMAPGGVFRVAGNNAVLIGQSGNGKAAHVSVFYDRVPTNNVGNPKSPKQEDELKAKDTGKDNAAIAKVAKTRLAHWERYLKVCASFQANKLGCVLLLTCKVGQATEFLKRTRSQFGVPLAAYRRRVLGRSVSYDGIQRTRIFLEGDADGEGTNVQMGEFFIPTPRKSDWTIIV